MIKHMISTILTKLSDEDTILVILFVMMLLLLTFSTSIKF